MGKPIRWSWPEGHEVQSTVPILRDQDGNDLVGPMPGSHGWRESNMAMMAAAPLMFEASIIMKAVFDDCVTDPDLMGAYLSEEGTAVIKEFWKAIETIQALREEESNDE